MNLQSCDLCPRCCGADRTAGKRGWCGAGGSVRIALVSLHQWEEPCLTGTQGAGTVFFSGCTMKCVFCQNYNVSHCSQGLDVSTERLAEIFMEQQQRGAASLDLVTPTHYVPQIIEALTAARSAGFCLPVVYNTGGYERIETVEALRGFVDVYLPDMKYYDAELARRYSSAPDYFRHASAALEKMVEQVGPCVIKDGLMTRGVLVRHLVLPGCYRDSRKILDYLSSQFGSSIYISLMNQFTPMPQATGFRELNRRLTTYEYNKVIDHALELGLTNCFIQEGHTASDKFIPIFDGSGVLREGEKR
ncbi:MAG: radical SAM protein [Pyramidobacter sp.]|nr:radical SAM protein [Pyramidobacter sp.]